MRRRGGEKKAGPKWESDGSEQQLDAAIHKISHDTGMVTRDATDSQGNTALHLACRSAKHDTTALLLEKCDAASVSKRNAHGKHPINLLRESNAVEDRESLDYTGSIYQLVPAYPEMVSISNLIVKQSATRHGKKRKLDQDQEE